ncbi:MAG: alpha/beta hydrolase [Proteobacteria bacterium]|nr:alpha/beta hydrolase [Pseudomonadota bacterium]
MLRSQGRLRWWCGGGARTRSPWALVLLGWLALGSLAWARPVEFERRTVNVTGQRGAYEMRYWVVGPRGRTAHRVYVAASGVMTQADLLRPLARELAHEGVYVVAFDKLGFGSSHDASRDAPRPLRYDDVVDAAHAMVGYVAHNLETELGVPADTPVHFAGLSLGASLVHAVGAERDPFLAGATALVPPFNGSHPHVDAWLRWGMRADPALSARWLNAGVGAIASLSQTWAHLGRAAWPLRWMQQTSTAVVGASYDWLLRPLHLTLPGTDAFSAAELLELAQALHPIPDGLLGDLADRVRGDRWPKAPIPVPTLTVLCEDDGLCPPRHALAAFDRGGLYDPHRAARAVVLLRGAGHLDPLGERWRRLMAELMVAHLDHAADPAAMREALSAAVGRAAKDGHTLVGAVTDPNADSETNQAALAPLRRILGQR